MIDYNAIDIHWIEKVSKANRKADMTLVEKTIRAFVLLEGLATAGLPFVFKGGTSLMLLTKSSKRMSIDIDIIMPDVPAHLTETLEDIAKKQGFIWVEPQERNGVAKVPKLHYKFWYNPIHRTANNEDCVLLDILTEQERLQAKNWLIGKATTSLQGTCWMTFSRPRCASAPVVCWAKVCLTS